MPIPPLVCKPKQPVNGILMLSICVDHAPLMNQPPASHAILALGSASPSGTLPSPSIPLLQQYKSRTLDASSSISFAVWTAHESAGQWCLFFFFF